MDLRLVLLIAFGSIPALCTLVFGWQAWQGQRQANAARRWTQTNGRVIEARIQETMVRRRRSTGVSSYRMAKAYAPHIVYEYQVNGVRYQNDRLRMGQTTLSSGTDAAQHDLDRYPLQSSVTVYHNPENPADSTLSPELAWGTRMLWLVALIMLLTTAALAVVFLNSLPITI